MRAHLRAGRVELLWPALAALALAGLLGLLLLGSGGTTKATAEPGAAGPKPYTDEAVPAENVVMLGATPGEQGAPPSTTWGLGELSEQGGTVARLVRYTQEGGWQLQQQLPAGFQPDHPSSHKPSPLEGQIAPEGYGVIAGTVPDGAETEQTLLVRRPGGAFQRTAPVPTEGKVQPGEEALLKQGQTLFGANRAPMIAPLAEASGEAGALVVPVYAGEGVDRAVLHWDGHGWSSEQIELPSGSEDEFKVLALAASGAEHAWLLARLADGTVALFRRVESGGRWSWVNVEVEVDAGHVSASLSVPVSGGAPAAGEPFGVFGASESSNISVESQLLTATSEGVWVDGVRTDVPHAQPYTTMYVRLQGEKGVIERSWCKAAPESPSCQGTLPLEPPLQYGRSIAWANSSTPYGERVITGLSEGVMLRFQGSSFTSVLSIGGEEHSEDVPGQLYGAAFSSPDEGWLGYAVPVHMTSSEEPDRLGYWPVATRHALLAVAPQPGAPVAELSSEALAVGESGGVARYKPGAGWLPETLFGPGERVEKPNLRAVAWPQPNRAYAVGEAGEMWLWRGETGLWERDPATPVNFRDNLYGIAFDPTNPARGYAVGSKAVGHGGVILRYGKTWSEETSLPAAVQNAEFTGIAFAGSEALVAYNVPLANGGFEGGLLVNGGGGWSVDQEERAVTEDGRVQSLAALPDGGAAVLAGNGSVRLYERDAPGTPWQEAAAPLPSGLAGSLALFRENGALRAFLSAGGAASLTKAIGFEPSPGQPPYEQNVASVTSGPKEGTLLRQTANGWSDERHSVNPVKQGTRNDEYDEPYHPDPVVATLASPDGSHAWVVGGISSELENEQTADVARYPAEGQSPNEGSSTIPVRPEETGLGGAGATTLAFGGGASCEAPCQDRVETDIGPDVWLAKALSVARGAGVSAFFYTGPMIDYSPYSGHAPPAPFAEEYERYAGLFGSGGQVWPVYTTSASGELEGEASASEALAEPLGSTQVGGWTPVSGNPTASERQACGCADDYYAVQNGRVEVIVLDDASGAHVEGSQRVWLEERLEQAGGQKLPAIVVGEADLSQQLLPGKHEAAAEALFDALVGRDPDGEDPNGYAASAYFYDAPENNVVKTISFAGASLRTFGSGTLGYERVANENTTEFHGAKGMLFAEVLGDRQTPAERAANLVPVAVRLIPVIGELAMEPEQGTLLRRSEVSSFSGLARRPRAGCRGQSDTIQCEESQYVRIPSICVGTGCGEAILPEYEFTSSRPDIGSFVKINTSAGGAAALTGGSSLLNAVLMNARGEPIQDGHEVNGQQVGATSGLFCAYNKGVTNVTISAGGLSYTLPVRVQAGSVREPCGTVPLRERASAKTSAAAAAPPPPAAAQPGPVSSSPAAAPPPVPPPPSIVPAPPARAPAVPNPPFLPLVAPAAPVLAFVPPPVPTPARPTPPSGTSPVTSPVEVAEHEDEEEEAPESVSNQALAYHPAEHEPLSPYLLGLVALAALAGASARRRGRGGRRGVRVAPATLNSSRSQRRWSDHRERHW